MGIALIPVTKQVPAAAAPIMSNPIGYILFSTATAACIPDIDLQPLGLFGVSRCDNLLEDVGAHGAQNVVSIFDSKSSRTSSK